MQLIGKVALVTGAGSGIGKACAAAFVRAGAKVGVLGVDQQQIDQVVANIGAESAVALLSDVADERQVEVAVQRLIERFGRLDVVVANAGINGVWAPIDDLTPHEWDRTLNTNLRGTYLTIHYSVPHLKRAGGGSIIVTCSINGTRTFSNCGATAYSVSKAGQLALVQMLAVELGPANIRINAICPGAIDTQIGSSTQQRNLENIRIQGSLHPEIPLQNRPGKPDHVAELALFLAADASRHITGSPIWIDGGQSLVR